jgi:hypothetical protein
LEIGTEQSWLLELNTSVPVRAGPPVFTGATVAVNVTDCPCWMVVAELTVVVVVGMKMSVAAACEVAPA